MGFFMVAFVYLLLSYVNLPKLWNVENLRFDMAYIYRHFMVIAEMAMAMGLGYCLYRTDYIFRMKKFQLFLLVLIASASFLLGGGLSLIGLVVSSISLMAMKFRMKILLLVVPFVFIAQSAYLIASMILIAVIVCLQPLMSAFAENTKTKIFALLSAFAVLLVLASSIVMEVVNSDPNAIWRLIVWTNEIDSLRQTGFTGVGFGSAYVTSNIARFTDNINMYFGEGNSGWEGLFLVANHNTFLNMFYRMGIIGGVLFMLINMMFVVWSVKCYQASDNIHKQYIGWSLANFLYQVIIILLNPGLEMLQFAVNYTFSLAVMLAVLLHANKYILTLKKIEKQ